MNLKNGQKGVKRLYYAELLFLFGAVVGFVAAVLGLAAAAILAADAEAAAAIGLGAGAGVLGIIAGIMLLVGFILYLVGVGGASKDSLNFKTALMFIIVGIVASLLNSIFDGISATWAGYVGDAFDFIRSIAELLTVLYIVEGIIDFAKVIGDENVMKKAATFKWLLMIVYGLSALIVLVALICGATVASAVVVSVLSFIAAVLSVVKYFVFLTLLAKAKNMDWDKASTSPADIEIEG